MPELKYIITADDSQYRKTLDNVTKAADNNAKRLSKQVNEALENEAANRSKVVDRIKQQQRSIQSLQIQLTSYQAIANSATDPSRLAEYNKKVQVLQAEITRLSNAGKKGFDDMGNAIKKSGSIFAKVWSGLRTAAYLIPGFGIAGLLALAIDPLTKLISNLDIFNKKLTDSQKEAQRLSEAFASSEYQKAVKAVDGLRVNIELAKDGLYDKKAILDQYNQSLGSVAGEVDNLTDVERGLAENADNYVKMTLFKAAANLALEDASRKAYEAEQERLRLETDPSGAATLGDRILGGIAANRGGMYGSAPSDLNTYKKTVREEGAERIKANIDQAEKERDEYKKLADKFTKQAAALAKQMGGVLGFTNEKDKRSINFISERQKLLQKINDLQDEYARKSMRANEAEVQAVRDKFKKLASDISKFNEDPNNKIKIDTSELDDLRDRAISDIIYKQETEALKLELEEQKKMYEDFEAWRDKAGAESARKRYDGLIDVNRTYLQRLQSMISELEAKDGRTGAEEARLEMLQALADKEIAREREKQDKLLISLLSFHQKMKALEEKYHRDIAAVGSSATQQQLDEMGRMYEEEAKKLRESYKFIADSELGQINEEEKIKKALAEMSKYRVDKETELQRKLLKIAIDAARKRIDVLKKEQQEFGIDNEAAIKKEEVFISRSEMHLEKLKDNYLIIGDALGDVLSQSSDEFVAKIGNMIREIGAAINQISTADSDLGKVQGWVGLIIALARNVEDGRNKAYEAEIKALKDISKEVSQRISFEAEVNRIYSERRKLENDSIFFGVNQADALKNAEKDIADANKTFEESLDALLKNSIFSEEGTGKRNFIGKKTGTFEFAIDFTAIDDLTTLIDPQTRDDLNWLDRILTSGWKSRAQDDAMKKVAAGFEKTFEAMGKSVEDFTSFSNEELLTFFSLMEQGGYIQDEGTRELIATAKEAAATALEAEKVVAQSVQNMIGVLGNDLKNAMVEAFKAGEDASKVFGDTVKGVIDDIITDMAFQALYGSALQTLQEEVKQSFGETGDGTIIDDVKRFRESTKGLAEVFEGALENAGISRNAADQPQGALAGAIRGITADQADLLAGQFGGMRLAQLEALELAKVQNSTLAMHSEYMTQQLGYLNSIAVNTETTAVNTGHLMRLEQLERSLRSIDRKIGITDQREAAGM